jgi:hypothetical protein
MLSSWEPPIGIELMTYALRGTRDLAAHALTAPMAPVIALMALAALGLSGNPVHKPVHEQEAVARPSDRLNALVLEDRGRLNGSRPVARQVTPQPWAGRAGSAGRPHLRVVRTV